MTRHLTNIFRSLYIGIILFEFLNLTGALDIQLEFSWFGLIITALFVWVLTEVFARKLGAQEYLPIMLPVSFLSIFLDMSGDIFKFYSKFLWYDSFLHFFSGITISIVLFLLIKNYSNKNSIPSVVRAFVVVGATNLIGVLYEVEEYLEDLFLNRKVLRLGDGPDTANDLLMNLAGSAIFIILMWIINKYQKKHD